MRLLIVSDAWLPQVNGVVTSLLALQRELELLGHQVRVLSPADFRCLPCPSYPEIPLAWNLWRLGGLIEAFAPDAVHLATEGPLGWAARRWLGKRGLDFTSAIHTRFPEYLRDRCPWLPLSWGYAFLRTFHRPSRAVLVSTPRLRDEFCAWRFQHLRLWRKGVDTELFHPAETPPAKERPPVFLYVGRLATEKNLEAFLDLELPGEKWLVGLVSLGLVLVTPNFDLASGATLGLLWAILSGLLFALLSLANRSNSGQVGPVQAALWQNLVVALCLLPFAVGELPALPALDWLWLALLGVFCTGLAHSLFVASLAVVKARTAALVFALEPVYGIAFAWLLFHETPGPRMFLGGALIILAIVLSARLGARGRKTAVGDERGDPERA